MIFFEYSFYIKLSINQLSEQSTTTNYYLKTSIIILNIMAQQNYDAYWNELIKELDEFKKRDWWDIVCEEELKLSKKEETNKDDGFMTTQKKKSKSPNKPPRMTSPQRKQQKPIKKEKSIKYSNTFALLNMIDE